MLSVGITLTALVVTILLSVAGAGFSTFYLNASKESLTFWRQKAEQLFVETELLERVLSTYFDRSYSIMDSNVSARDEGELDKAGNHLAVMKMLIGLYFSGLTPMLSRIVAATATAHRGLRAVQRANQADRPALLDSVDAAVCELKDALDGLKDGLTKEARLLNRGGLSELLWRPLPAAAIHRVSQVAV